MTHIYIAAPLFSEADRDYNVKVMDKMKEAFGEKVSYYLPQLNDAINDKTAYASSVMIAEGDYAEIEKTDILVALIDGASTDVGVGVEVGIAFERGLKMVGLYTDVRRLGAENKQKIDALSEIGENQFDYKNLMLTGLIKKNGSLVGSIDELIKEIGLMIA